MEPLKVAMAVLLIFFGTLSSAQTPGKQPTIKESVEQVKEDFNDLKNIFKKKGDVKDAKNEAETPSGNTKSENVLHLQGGLITENVVYLDADRMGHFNNGKAIIHKGTASAMINAAGQFVFPYNTYRFFDIDNTYVFKENEVFANGFFQYSKESQGGFKSFMNAEGDELTASQQVRGVYISLNPASRLLEGAKELYDQPKNKQNKYPVAYYYITNTGNVYVRSIALVEVNDDIGVYSEYKNGWKFGYMKLSGEKLTEAVFDEADPFANGMAVVGQKDQYGIKKYGYVNEKGELGIPLMFSIKPSKFSAGFAKVKPKDIGEFQYAFINKKGEIVFKQTAGDTRKLGNHEFESFQSYGLTIVAGGGHVLDSAFNLMSKADFFARYGIEGISHFQGASYKKPNGGSHSSKGLFSVVGETNPKIYFSNNDMNHDGILRGKELRIGFINLATKTVVLPAFSRIGYFDPVSKLAYAEVETVVKKGGHNTLETTKGYINEKGEWVILQAKESKW